jgi:hypothetical protein
LHHQCGWQCRRRGGDDDGVEGRFFCPSLPTVPKTEADIAVSECRELVVGFRGRFRDNPDSEDMHHQRGKNGGLIAATSANLEHPIA